MVDAANVLVSKSFYEHPGKVTDQARCLLSDVMKEVIGCNKEST